MAWAQMWLAKLRGLKEGLFQTASADVHDHLSREALHRLQDYGFSGHPVDGQGLVLEIGGLTIVVRMDRAAERPALAPYEVCMWHKEGHRVTMRAGKVVDVDCELLRVTSTTKVEYITPSFTINGAEVVLHNHGGAVPPMA